MAHQYRLFEAATQTRTEVPSHFMGALILESKASPKGTSIPTYALIDGQQRVITLFMLMAAFRDNEAFLKSASSVDAKNDLALVKQKYGKGSSPRLLAREQDQAALTAILGGKCLKAIPETIYDSQLAQAYRYFRYQLWLGKESLDGAGAPPASPRPGPGVVRGSYDSWPKIARGKKSLDAQTLDDALVHGLQFLEILLTEGDEHSSVIFETMNSKGTPLKQFDLIRNSVFVRMPDRRDNFHVEAWQPMEEMLSSVTYSAKRKDSDEQFLYEYMIAAGHDKVARDKLHRRWLDEVIANVGYAVTPKSQQVFERDYAMPLVRAGWIYPIAVGHRQTVSFGSQTHAVSDEAFDAIKSIMSQSGGPAVPLVMQAILDLSPDASAHNDAELLEALNHIESYIVREVLSGESLSPLRATLMTVAASIDRPMTPAKLASSLASVGWKDDAAVLEAVKSVALDSGGRKVIPLLRGIERTLSGIGAHSMPFGAKAGHYSLEHVFPQTENIGSAWEAELKAWKVKYQDMDSRRYVLGNLTAVTNYDNKRNGKKPFAAKRALIVKCAPLSLHRGIEAASRWDPKTIDRRTVALAKAALAYWPGPA